MVRVYKNWLIEEHSHVATLSLNRASVKNTLDSETLVELRDICETLSQRVDIWAIVLQGQGKHFSTGLDPDLILDGIGQSEEYVHDMVSSHHECLGVLEKIEKPTIAAIHGFCIGGGLLLALCCDFRIASERTVFSLPEIRLGIPILWGTHRIVRVTGTARAKQLIMLGGRFKAKKAMEFGLVHEVVKDEKLDSAVDALLAKLQRSPPRTLGLAKRFIDGSMNPAREGTEELELEAIAELSRSPDLVEAYDSYFERRSPRFTGR